MPTRPLPASRQQRAGGVLENDSPHTSASAFGSVCERPRPAVGGGARGPLRSVSVVSTNQFKNGNHIEVDGTVFKILEFQHVKPGKGGAFVRTKRDAPPTAM